MSKKPLDPEPRFEDFYDTEDPRGPSTSEHTAWRAALARWQKTGIWKETKKPSDGRRTTKIRN
jgi:hypothetical protein